MYGFRNGDCFPALFEEGGYFLDDLAQLGGWEGGRHA